MKHSILPSFLVLLATATVHSFLLVPTSTNHRLSTCLEFKEKGNNDEAIKHQWQEEAARLDAVEHSLEDDPDLQGLVEPSHKYAKRVYMDAEAHKHDSLMAEIQHAIETDPDLANVVESKKKKTANANFMAQEAHVHDSLLEEVAHAVDNDPDL